MNKEQCRAYQRAYYEAHKEKINAAAKAWYQEHKEECKATMKAWREENRDYWKAWNATHREEVKAYKKAEVNSLGQTKSSIRWRSRHILKQMHLHIPGYEIHHCFGYDDPSKFIYISRSLHLKIHQYLRDNNIDAGHDHWMAIRDMVNATDEFMYIKC